MNIKLSQSELCLLPRQTLSFGDAAGVRVEARAGAVWITQDHDLRDVVLKEGESYTLPGDGRAIVQAFGPSRIRLVESAAASRLHDAPGWRVRIGNAFRPLLHPAWA